MKDEKDIINQPNALRAIHQQTAVLMDDIGKREFHQIDWIMINDVLRDLSMVKNYIDKRVSDEQSTDGI